MEENYRGDVADRASDIIERERARGLEEVRKANEELAKAPGRETCAVCDIDLPALRIEQKRDLCVECQSSLERKAKHGY